MPQRYWIPTAMVFILFTIHFGLQAWYYLNTPIILDYFYNPTLKMYEPVEIMPLDNTWSVLLFLPTVVVIWWSSPLYIFIPFNLLIVWCIFLFIVYRPCIALR